MKLSSSDWVKGIVIAAITVILGALQQAVTAHGFDFGAYDWHGILDLAWKAAGAYILKNFLSDENGKVLGRIG